MTPNTTNAIFQFIKITCISIFSIGAMYLIFFMLGISLEVTKGSSVDTKQIGIFLVSLGGFVFILIKQVMQK